MQSGDQNVIGQAILMMNWVGDEGLSRVMMTLCRRFHRNRDYSEVRSNDMMLLDRRSCYIRLIDDDI